MGVSRDIAERAYAAMAAHDVAALTDLCAPSCEMVEAGMRFRGPEEIGPYLQAYITAFPDMGIEVRRMLEDGESIAAEVRFFGTQTGPMAMPQGELTPSGRRMDLETADFITTRDGKISSWRVYLDMMEFMQQLGLVPSPAEAAAGT